MTKLVPQLGLDALTERADQPTPIAIPTISPIDVSTANTHTLAPEVNVREVFIDLARLKEAGMVTPDNSRSQISRDYRVIKRPLLNNVLGRSAAPIPNANLIMVTSGLQGEGKSFSSINLAMSIAMELDHTVLLVEADVIKPAIFKYLGLPHPATGLVDYLEKQTPLSEILYKTNIPKLALLPAGPPHERAAELLSSAGMTRLMLELSERYTDRIIIIDSPPLLLSSEAVALSGLVGQIVMVVEAGKTPQTVVKDALALVNSQQVVGVVLNKTTSKERGYGYGVYGDFETEGA